MAKVKAGARFLKLISMYMVEKETNYGYWDRLDKYCKAASDVIAVDGGSNVDATIQMAYDCILLAEGCRDYPLSCSEALKVGAKCKIDGIKEYRVGTPEYDAVFGRFIEGVKIEGSKGEKYVEEKVEEEPAKAESNEEKDKEEVQESKESTEADEDIVNFFRELVKPTVLMSRYESLFKSGFQVDRPDGLLTKDGLAKISGNKRVYHKGTDNSSAYTAMYNYFLSKSGFVESDMRSFSSITETLYEGYFHGKPLYYFPNKLLEFAYGCNSPKRDRESATTYDRHPSSANWKGYHDELIKNIKATLGYLVTRYVKTKMTAEGIDDYKSISQGEVKGFIDYCHRCLSFCVIFDEYNVPAGDLVSVRFKVCDESGIYLNNDITPEFVATCFSYSAGEDSFSVVPSYNEYTKVSQFGYEFDHTLSQVTPLFAYKALESILANGETVSWDNLILGKAEDGTILQCGSEGLINLARTIAHYIIAGSRAGKGVMTLNFLASAVMSKKLLLYGDNKPDMAALIYRLSGGKGFVFIGSLNNAKQGGEEDLYYRSFDNSVRGYMDRNYPLEAQEAFGRTYSMSEIGDLVYARAYMLVVAILYARFNTKSSKKAMDLCEGRGIVFVADELNNLSITLSNILDHVGTMVPPLEKAYESAMEKGVKERTKKGATEEEAREEVLNKDLKSYFGNNNYYALSFINSILNSLSYIGLLKNAGKDETALSHLDMIVLGQEDFISNCMPMDNTTMSAISGEMNTGRYSTASNKGFTSKFRSEQWSGTKLQKLLSSMSFLGSTVDMFLGNNERGFLANTDKNSRAFGKVDGIASNFAYLSSVTDATGKVLTSGKVADNIKLANEATYFKPYLILNDATEQFTNGMKARWDKNKIPKETQDAILAANCDPNDPTKYDNRIGFPGYVGMMGLSNTEIEDILGASGRVVNTFLENVMGYTDGWMSFICDFRAEWMFDISVLSNCLDSGIKYCDVPISERSHMKEWVGVHPERFQGGYVDPTSISSNLDSSYLDDLGSSTDDFSDMDRSFSEADKDMKEAMGDNEVLDEDEEFDFGDSDDIYSSYQKDDTDSVIGDTYSNLPPSIQEQLAALAEEIKKLEGVISQLMGTEGDGAGTAGAVNQFYTGTDIPIRDVVTNPYKNDGITMNLGDSLSNINFSNDDVSCLDDLMSLVTQSVFATFGEFERYNMIGVSGGNLIVNRTYFKCNINTNNSKNIPYDVRRRVNSGAVAELFNFNTLYAMKGLRDIHIDSENFFGSYIAPEIGCSYNGDCIKTLFNSLPLLERLKIGKTLYTRDTYIKQLEEVGKRQSRIESLSWGSNAFMIRNFKKNLEMSKAHFGLGKSVSTGKNCKKVLIGRGILRAGGTLVTGAGVLATGAVGLGTSGIKKAVGATKKASAKKQAKMFSSNLKDLWNN